jgi:protein-S-isoprenylcysteine O-methyltransferase Ste14
VGAVTAKLVMLCVGLAAFAFMHSGLAALRVRGWGEGLLGSAQRYRLVYTVLAVLVLGGLFLATRGEYPIVWRAVGVARVGLLLLQGIGAVGFVLTVRSFKLGEFLGLRAPGATSTGGRFRTDGLYGLCRHPLYFFTSLFFSAWPTMDLRALVIAVWLWVYAFVGSIFEERKLVAELGEVYVAYRRRTPRILPLGRWGGGSLRTPKNDSAESF